MSQRLPQAETERLLIDIPEAQRVTGLGRSTIYELLSSGEIESVKVRKRRLIPYDALRAWLAALRSKAA